MIRQTIFAALLALSATAALPAAAQVTHATSPATPALKRAITVNDNLVRIGDLVDNAGRLASVAIFRAPDVGTTGTVSTAQVLAALRPHSLVRVDTGDIDEVEVTRPGRTVAAGEIETSIVHALAAQYRLGDPKSLTVSFDRDVRALTVEPSAKADLQITRAVYDPRNGRFDVSADLPGSAMVRRLALRFTGTLVQMTEVTVLTRGLARGEIVKASDVSVERRPKNEAVTDAAGAGDKLIGLAARQALRAGQVLRRNDVAKPDLVKRDDLVTLIYEVPGILLTTRAKALESGTEGDIVSVLNIQSKRTVQGIVTGNGQVTMVAAAPRLATAAIDQSE